MKSLTKFLCSLYLILLFFPVKGISQEGLKDTIKNQLVEVAREIISIAGNCALITLDEDGSPRVRTMDPFLPESDFTIWFGTNAKSRKVGQISKDSRVTLYYFEPSASAYVTIHGTAEIVSDPKEKEIRWKKQWEAFYPNYPDGFCLIKVSPKWMEVISQKHGIFGDSITWQAPKHSFDSSK